MDDGTVGNGLVLQKQPKKCGTNSNWVNIQADGMPAGSVDWERVSWWNRIENPQIALFSSAREGSSDVIVAKKEEFAKLKENSVFEVVPDQGQTAISTKWVFTEKKLSDGGVKVKARLVAKGFEEKNSADLRTDSPTCSRQSLRMVFAVAPTMRWNLWSLDISSAFLQGNELLRDVFVRPPPDLVSADQLWKLRRCLYGLNDAPRAWYDRVKSELLHSGGTKSRFDEALFMWYDQHRGLEGVMVTHVDDFVFTGTVDWYEKVVCKLCSVFKISSQDWGSFKYTGLNVSDVDGCVLVDQFEYVNSLNQIELNPGRASHKGDLLTVHEKAQLRFIAGQLLWATTQTRPDCAFDSCWVSNIGKNPTVQQLIDANKAVRKLKSDKTRLLYCNLGDPAEIKVLVYADASHANLANGVHKALLLLFSVEMSLLFHWIGVQRS